MNNPWVLLELDADTASEKDVKRAYAKRLKVTRPDQNPEGFKELNDAYQYALFDLQRKSASVFADEDFSPPSLDTEKYEEKNGEVERVVSMPQAVAGEHEIKQATAMIEDSIVSERDITSVDMRGLEQLLYEFPMSARVWSQHVAPLIEQYPCHPQLLLKPDALIFEIEQGSCEVTLAIINRLDRLGKMDAILGIAQYFHKFAERIASPLGARIFARLACSAGMWQLPIVDVLANAAYKNLLINERDYFMDLIDQHKSLAIHLNGVPPVWTLFWTKFFLGAYDHEDWTSEECEAALAELAKSRSRIWPCYKDIIKRLPLTVAARLPAIAEISKQNLKSKSSLAPQFLKTWQFVETRPKTTANTNTAARSKNANWLDAENSSQQPRTNHRSVARNRDYPESKKNYWPVAWIVFIVIKALLLLSRCAE